MFSDSPMVSNGAGLQPVQQLGEIPPAENRRPPDFIRASWVDVEVCNIARDMLGSNEPMAAVGGDRVARFTKAGCYLSAAGAEIAHFHDAVVDAAAAGDPLPRSRVQEWVGLIHGLNEMVPVMNHRQRVMRDSFAALADTVAVQASEMADCAGIRDRRPLLPQLPTHPELRELPRSPLVEDVVYGLAELLSCADDPASGSLSQAQCMEELVQVRADLRDARYAVAAELQGPDAGPGHAQLFNLLDKCARLADLAERRFDPRCEFPLVTRTLFHTSVLRRF